MVTDAILDLISYVGHNDLFNGSVILFLNFDLSID